MRWANRFSARSTPGALAWLGLAAYVVGVDAALILNGKKTMSQVFEGTLRDPVRKYPVVVAWAIVTGHLFTPVESRMKKLDPIYQFGCVSRRVMRK